MFNPSKICKSFFFRYIITILIACILPTVILSSIYYASITKTLKEKVLISLDEFTSLIENTLDMQFLSINQIPSIISSDKRIYTYLNSEYDPLEANEIRKILNSYILSNSIIENFLIYSSKHDYVTSAKGIYPVKDTVTTPKAEDAPIVSLFNNDEINSLKFYRLYPVSENPTNVLVLRMPIFYDVDGTRLSSVLTIDCWKLRNLILNSSSKNEEFNRNVVITDYKNDMVVAVTNYDNIDFQKVLPGLKLESSNGTSTIAYNNKKYIVSYAKSVQSGYNYINIVSQERILKSINYNSIFFIIIFIAVMVFIGVVVFIFTHVNYSPIKQLRDISEMVLEGSDYKHNEIDGVKTALNFLINKVNALNIKVENSKDAVKTRVIRSMINAMYSDRQAFNEEAKQYGIDFTYDNYVTVIFNFRNLEIPPDQFISKVEESISSVCMGYGISNIDINQLTFILNLENNTLDKEVDALNNIKCQMEQDYKCSITIGVGNVYNSLQLIGKSYIEAKDAINYRLILGEKVLLFSTINVDPYGEKTGNMQIRDFGDLQSAIVDADLESVSNILDDTVNYIKNNQISLFHARCICFDIINSVMKALSKFSDRKFSYVGSNIINLGDFVTIEDLIGTIKEIGNQVYRFSNYSSKKNSEYDIKSIKHYINHNFDNPLFSVQGIAQNFGMSLSMLSQYFKASTNQNIIDYLTELRIKKAKELLISTNMYIGDIVKNIGYYSTSSFIKKFRQITGHTPGEYRELYKNIR